ncbi:MAG: c-type cytochrome, partial [Verrucomicrobiota bacterium]
LSEDDSGRLFYNSNSDQLRGDLIPSHYLYRNPYFLRPAGVNVEIPVNQLVWPARVNPGINRGYRPEMLRDGKLKEFTAACSPFIYRGDLLPKDFYGNTLVCEPAGNFVRRNLMWETNGTLAARNAYDKKEFLTSTDERFRPVSLTSGPDGALYIIDLYRGVLQHRISLTSYLRKQSEERGLDKPLHLGRIYRIVPDGKKVVSSLPQFSKETPTQWVAHLPHSNGWYRSTAQRLLVEKRDMSVVPEIKKIMIERSAGLQPASDTAARKAGYKPVFIEHESGKIHALWTLEGLGQVDVPTIATALSDKNPKVRAAAIRVSESLFNSEDKSEIVEKLLALAGDSSPDVQLQLALTLGEANDKTADIVLANLTKSAATNTFLADAVLSGVRGRELEMLETLVGDSFFKNSNTFARVLSGLAACVVMERRNERVQRLLELTAVAKPASRQQLLLDGIFSTSSVTSKKPVKLPGEPKALIALEKITSKTIQPRVEKISPLFTWPGKPGALPEPVIPPLSVDEQQRFEKGKELFAGSCAACHQTHGLGMDGLAPPLVDSEWVLGSDERLVRIVLHGLNGPISVKGAAYNLDMPGMGIFADEQVAGILTYIRREWENGGKPIRPETVRKIRAETSQRQEAWTSAELLKIP